METDRIEAALNQLARDGMQVTADKAFLQLNRFKAELKDARGIIVRLVNHADTMRDLSYIHPMIDDAREFLKG